MSGNLRVALRHAAAKHGAAGERVLFAVELRIEGFNVRI